MTETPSSESAKIDERLAKFTDQLLSGVTSDLDVASDDPEMIELQTLVMRLNQAIGHSQPSPALSKQIWSHLASEWQRSTVAIRPASRWQQWKQTFNVYWSALRTGTHQRTYVWALAASVVIILIVVGLNLSNFNSSIPGAAGAGDLWLPLFGVAILVVGGLIWWWFRNKH